MGYFKKTVPENMRRPWKQAVQCLSSKLAKYVYIWGPKWQMGAE